MRASARPRRKTRAEVRGGGRKPWRQKGTGRARQGSTRAPQLGGWRCRLGSAPRGISTQDIPKKMRGLAVRSALSAKVRDERLIVIDGLERCRAEDQGDEGASRAHCLSRGRTCS